MEVETALATRRGSGIQLVRRGGLVGVALAAAQQSRCYQGCQSDSSASTLAHEPERAGARCQALAARMVLTEPSQNGFQAIGQFNVSN